MSIPVFLLNPHQKSQPMATHKKKRTSHKRRPTHRRRATHRRRTTHARRRNPSFDFKGVLIAGAVGLAAGGAIYALHGTTLGNYWIGGIEAGVGLVGGGLLSAVSRPAGAALAGAGVAAGGATILQQAMAPEPSQPSPPAGDKAKLGALMAQLQAAGALGATSYDLGAVEYDLGELMAQFQ